MCAKRCHLLAAAALLSLVLFGGLDSRIADAEEVIRKKDRERLRKELQDLSGEVKMVMFTQELECQYCAQTRQLLTELASLSDRLKLVVLDFVHDREEAEGYRVDKIPAIVLLGDKDVGIRYYGVPAGYELAALVETIRDLSLGSTNLEDETRERLRTLAKDVHIQVFVTPTCPHCPRAVRTAYMLAQENDFIRADVLEAIEFPHLANRYQVRGVPTVVINETINFVGAQPEALFVDKILEAAE
jgi:glutaredoxin-like protein